MAIGNIVSNCLTAGNTVGKAREQKHILISHAIGSLESTLDGYSELLNELQGTPPLVTGKQIEAPTSSFADVISGSPGRLTDLNERFINILGALRNTIL